MSTRATRVSAGAILAATVLFIGVLYVRGGDQPPTAGDQRPPPPDSIAALGDSITTGYNACGRFEDCPERSWSTGSDKAVNSQYQRLRAINPAIDGNAFNFAESGARADDLPRQAAQAVSAGVEYVTILIGANDVCRDTEAEMTSVGDFRDSVDEALAVLEGGLPGVRIFVSSIPDIYRLWEVERDDALARIVWGVGGICQTMLDEPTSDSDASVDRRSQVRDHLVALNTELRLACGALGDGCRYDGDAVFQQRFVDDAVSSWDHFHPSEIGQAALAEVTAAAGFSWR